jgi:hypothetical protein
MANIMDKLCRGCLSHERVGEVISSYSALKYGECPGYIMKDINCPCQRCLVKAMCDVICKDFEKTKWFGADSDGI